jgi:folate-dependent phosphoribosylglycinamide formyltransferase PurN
LPDSKIVMLAGDHPSTLLVYNAARRRLAIQHVIIEDRVPMRQLLLRRIRKLGVFTVFGQILFKLLVEPYLRFRSRARIQEIKHEFGFDESEIGRAIVTRVDSVNSERTEALLRELDPDVVVVNGTRIISKRILTCIRAPFINMHAGITPLYRGAHGAYWALVERNRGACGVTVHLVDPGIDTGKILRQATIIPTSRDSFVTYPFLQLGAGIPILISAVADACNGHIECAPKQNGQSKLWSHPTAFGYLYHRIASGVK